MQQSPQELYLKYLQIYTQEQENISENLTNLIKLGDIDLKEHNQQILEILNLEFKPQKLFNTAQLRISNEVKEFYSKRLEHIKVYKLKAGDQILNHLLIIMIKGNQGTPYEGGNYSFILQFPENFPYSPPLFRSLIPLKHPHIYPNMRLCTPTINEQYAIQQYSLLELVQTWHAILHRKPNLHSLANTEVNEQYNDEFIKLQAQFHSDQNPIIKLFQTQNIEEDENELQELYMSI